MTVTRTTTTIATEAVAAIEKDETCQKGYRRGRTMKRMREREKKRERDSSSTKPVQKRRERDGAQNAVAKPRGEAARGKAKGRRGRGKARGERERPPNDGDLATAFMAFVAIASGSGAMRRDVDNEVPCWQRSGMLTRIEQVCRTCLPTYLFIKKTQVQRDRKSFGGSAD